MSRFSPELEHPQGAGSDMVSVAHRFDAESPGPPTWVLMPPRKWTYAGGVIQS